MLAVTLGHLESVKVLINNEANVNVENSDGWTGRVFHLLIQLSRYFIVILTHYIYYSQSLRNLVVVAN